jgi:small subunit ribosomal protein S6
MPLYELVFIVRQDASTSEVDKLVDDYTETINSYEGSVIKNEYWGLRDLAYQIKKNNKGHYVFLGIEAPNKAIREVERKMKLNEDVIRINTIRVEEISNEPSPLLKTSEEDGEEESINVTENG